MEGNNNGDKTIFRIENKDILFYEKQKFNRTLVILIFVFYNAIFGFLLWNASPVALYLSIIISFLSLIFVLLIKLELIITNEGIAVRFFPFSIKTEYYSWDYFRKLYIKRIKTVSEWGGYGLRINWFRQETGYLIHGDLGLMMEFRNGEKTLISTKKANKIIEVLNKLEQYKT